MKKNNSKNSSSIEGIKISSLSAGIRYENRLDVTLISIDVASNSVVKFTNNQFPAAPVVVSKKHLECIEPKFFIINSGNANAATGEKGVRDTSLICGEISRLTGCLQEEVLMFSTGVIGEALPTEKILNIMPKLLTDSKKHGWKEAAESIMTTDTFPKITERKIVLGKSSYNLIGICKGSGMINPNMATMLAFVATDLPLTKRALDEISQDSLKIGFNKITVDGETSTNDAFVLISTNSENKKLLDVYDAEFEKARNLIAESCQELAKSIARDGEGATKLINIKIIKAWSDFDANLVASAVANSLLVKTAFFAEDPNWGRIFSAIGASGAQKITQDKLDIFIGNRKICDKGKVVENLDEGAVVEIMKLKEFEILIDLNAGLCSDETWTCDLGYDYIKINAEYRS